MLSITYCFGTINQSRYGTFIFHTPYDECYNWYYCELKVIAMTTTAGLVSTLCILTAIPAEIRSLAIEIQSNRDSNCQVAANSDRHS